MRNQIDLIVALMAGLVVTYGLLYVSVLTLLGLRHTRRDGVAIGAQQDQMNLPPNPGADLHGMSFHFLIPALNEEEVIGGTITALLAEQAGAAVLVVDDGSSDRTAAIVASFAGTGRVQLLTRTPPEARQGKGKALNAGLAVLRTQLGDADTSRTIIAVMDADGRMTPNATAAVAGQFAADPSVGGLQLVVRIRNRDTRILTFQDMEFWSISSIGQFGRVAFGSVSMGGNGQFTRLSALDEIGPEPWSQSLTEDLDLGISLSVLGWRTTSTAHAHVSQQGVPDLRRLLRQRTRWYQGHMMAMARLPELAASRYLPTMRFLELAAYLALPWGLSLPWPLIQAYLIYQTLWGAGLPATHVGPLLDRTAVIALWYLLSFAPTLFWGVIYYRRNRGQPFWSSMWLAHLLVPWSWVSYLAAYRALWRIVTGANTWTKTARETEDSHTPRTATTTTTAAADRLTGSPGAPTPRSAA